MFRIILVLTCTLFSFTTLAETRLEVTPARPVSCAQYDHANVNWVYKINKIQESSEQVTFEFITQHGSCVNGKVVPAVVDERTAGVSVFRNGLVMPWNKEGAEARLEQVSETELRVSIVFDKTILFKKKVERTLTMFFQPGISKWVMVNTNQGPRSYLWVFQFPWNMLLSVDQTTKMSSLRLI